MIFDLEKFRSENQDVYGDTPLRDIAKDLLSVHGDSFAKNGIKTVDDWADKEGLRETWDRDQQNIIRAKRQREIDKIRQQNLENMNFVSRSVARGVDQLQAMTYGFGALAGELTGIKPLRQAGLKGYQRNMEEAAMYPGTELSDVTSAPGIMKGVKGAQWAVEKVGENLPILLGALVSGGVGGIVGGSGRVVGNKVVQKALGGVLSKAVEKQLPKSLIRKLATRQGISKAEAGLIQAADKEILSSIGQKIGISSGASVLEAGGNYGDLRERGMEGKKAAATSLAFGIASGAVESMGGLGPRVLNRLFGKHKAGIVSKLADKALGKLTKGKTAKKEMGILSRMWREAADEAPSEFAQESVQEILSLMNVAANDPEFKVLSMENLKQVGEAGLGGAAVGGILGGTMGAVSKYKSSDGLDDEINKEIIDRLASNPQDASLVAGETTQQEQQQTQPVDQVKRPETLAPAVDDSLGKGENEKRGQEPTKTGNVINEPIDTTEGSYVDYNGIKGFLRKKKDGYHIITPEEDILVESGESGKTIGELGIQKLESPIVSMEQSTKQRERILDKYGAFDPSEKKLITKAGKELTFQSFNYDGNKIVSATFKDDNGNKKTIRDKEVVNYINRVQSLYKGVQGESKIQYDAAEGSRWNEEARKINPEIQKEIAAKPEEEIEFDMYDELANGGWLKHITQDEAIEIADDLGLDTNNKHISQIKSAIQKKARRWLELWDTFNDVDKLKHAARPEAEKAREQAQVDQTAKDLADLKAAMGGERSQAVEKGKPVLFADAKPGDRLVSPNEEYLVEKGIKLKRDAEKLAKEVGGKVFIDRNKWAVVSNKKPQTTPAVSTQGAGGSETARPASGKVIEIDDIIANDSVISEITNDQARDLLGKIKDIRSADYGYSKDESATDMLKNPRKSEALNRVQEKLKEKLGILYWQQPRDAVKRLTGMPFSRHEKYVIEAYNAGKEIPEKVLKDYPELAKKYGKAESKAEQLPDLSAYDLKKTKVRIKERVEGTNKQVTIEKTAEKAISDLNDRIDKCEMIAQCLGGK